MVESMGVASGCGCKEVYKFPHITYPYSCIYVFFFLQQYRNAFGKVICKDCQIVSWTL